MSQAVADGLFSPEGVPLKDPAEVERALAQMWKPAGEKATGKAGAKTATRVSVANLIVVAPASQWEMLLDELAELSPMYPTRTIILLIGHDEPLPTEITVSVSAICHVPQEGQPQVCCEQIILRAGPQHVEVLDKTLLPLLESDVPVMCWWRYNCGAWPTLFSAVRNNARRIIMDNDLVQQPAESSEHCAVRDLGWYRTARLRELLAQMFDGCRPDVIQAIERVEIDTGGMFQGEIEGFWLAAFLAGQLGWSPSEKEPIGLARGVTGVRFRFLSANRPIGVQITTHAGGGRRLRGVSITGGSSTFEFQLQPGRGDQYRITIRGAGVCEASRSMQVPIVGTSQALAAALAGRSVDPAFERAWPIAAWIAGGAEG